MPKRHPLPPTPAQIVTPTATDGTFTLTYARDTTSPIAYDATPGEVEAVLAELPGVGAGNVSVTGEAGGPYAVSFGGELSSKIVAELRADSEGLAGEVTVTPEIVGGWHDV